MWNAFVWFWTGIWGWISTFIVWTIELPLSILLAFNNWYEWAAYFVSHYEEYLLSDYFVNYVWAFGDGGSISLDEIWRNLEGWVYFGIYLFFWPITFPVTIAVVGVILVVLLLYGIYSFFAYS